MTSGPSLAALLKEPKVGAPPPAEGGGAASGAFGELSSDALQVDLYVSEEHAEEAKRIIEEEQARPREDATPWTCGSCSETNEPGFDLGGKCRSARGT